MRTDHDSLYPENYILLGLPDARKRDADAIVYKAKISRPEKFEGNQDSISFELRYVPPFDKGFYELKRLQGTAAEAAGRRNEFMGYMILDLSKWLTHHNEEYLNKTLLFLSDMSDSWKYIFLISDQNAKASRELTCKILTVFLHDRIPCQVKEADANLSHSECVSAMCRDRGILCSQPVRDLFQEMLTQGFGEDVVSAFLDELAMNSNGKISMGMLVDFMAKRGSVIRYMLTQKEYDRFMHVIEQGRGNYYGEK